MATALELLSNEVCDDILIVDLESRRIIIPNTVENLGVESDDSVRVLHFQVPRQYCEVDLSTFAIRVNFKNTSGAGGSYDIPEFAVEDDTIKFDWLIERPVTVKRGNVVFNVCFREIVNDAVEREFNTSIASLPVLEGLETGEDLSGGHTDIFEQLREELMNNADDVILDYIKENPDKFISSGDMRAEDYDPQGKKQDIFKYVDDQIGSIGAVLDAINGEEVTA